MKDEEFKNIIYKYVVAEIDLLPNPEEIPEHPPYSHKFNKKMKHLMRAGDSFGGRLHMYYFVRSATAVLLVILSLVVANQTSAAIFGFNPWEEVNKLLREDIGMEQKSYEKSNSTPDNTAKPISDVPTYIPDGYVEVDRQSGKSIITAEWKKSEEDGSKYGLSYNRDIFDKDATYLEDVEYDDVYKMSVMNYIAKVYIKKNEKWIKWEDKKYRYMILINDPNIEKSTLKSMAESIYEKK